MRRTRTGLLGWVVLAVSAWAAGGCSGSTTEEQTCSAGQERACECADGTASVRTCLEDGSAWGPCDCAEGIPECAAGATRECYCAGGDTGSQTCLDTGEACLIDVINVTGTVTAADQWTCAESAAADGVFLTAEFNELFPCRVCNQRTADLCLARFTDPAECG